MTKTLFLEKLKLQRGYLSDAEYSSFVELAENKLQDFDSLAFVLALIIKSKPYKI